jgi:subtilisin family serine protease
VDQYSDPIDFELDEDPRINDIGSSEQKRWEGAYNYRATWNTAMVSESQKRQYQEDGEYVYAYMDEPKAGTGVDIYILDTGVRVTHEQFEGRASYFKGLKPGDRSPYMLREDMVCHRTICDTSTKD